MPTAEPLVNFDSYIKTVLKQLHPDTGITTNSLSQVNSLLNMVGTRIAEEAAFLCSTDMSERRTKGKRKKVKESSKCTLTSRAVQSAVEIVLPGELAKHAVHKGQKAVAKFVVSSAGDKKNPISMAKRAGLQFPPSRTEKLLRTVHCGRTGKGAPVFLAAVLEYLAAESPRIERERRS